MPARGVTDHLPTRYERREPHRPYGRVDEFAPSRHESVGPCQLIVMFNSHRATFELAYGDTRALSRGALPRMHRPARKL